MLSSKLLVLLLRIERRFTNGLSLLGHYAFSKFIDNVASADEYGDPGSYMDAYNRALDRSLSGSDIPHRLVLTGLYETPALNDRHWFRWIAGSWRVGLLTTLQSGPTCTGVTAANTTNAFPAGPLRPNLLRDPRLRSGERTLGRWFNTLAFQAPALFFFGNAPRSGLRGDSLQTVDLTIEKEFPQSERLKLGLRGEFYNLLNYANFELPGHVFGAADFGTVLSAGGERSRWD